MSTEPPDPFESPCMGGQALTVGKQLYLQGIDFGEIIAAVRARRAPMMSASAGLRL